MAPVPSPLWTLFLACALALSMACAQAGRAGTRGNLITIQVPQATRMAATAAVKGGMPRVEDTVSVVTLPGIDQNGKDVPPQTLKVTCTGSEADVLLGNGRKVEFPRATGKASTSANSTTSAPAQNIHTLGQCNVAPPPFRTLLNFEDAGSLANGVVSLLFHRGSSISGFCSGWLVHPLRVVTAAHCIYNLTSKRYYFQTGQTLVVATGLNGRHNADRYSSAGVQSVTLSNSYTSHSEWGQSLGQGTDTAVLTLSGSLSGRTYGWALPAPNAARMLLGYPATSQNGFDQIGDIGPNPSASPSYGCRSTSGNIICEDVSAEGGHSGSPLFQAYNSDVVVGTLSGVVEGSCPAFTTLAVPRVNGGVGVTDLLQSSGCSVSTSNGASRVSRCP